MGNYDTIQDPIQGQPISSSLYGARVKAAIVDLDRRMSAYDASTGVGKASSVTPLVLANTTETAALTITGFPFRAGYAYKASYRSGMGSATAGTLCNVRIRKYNATPASGADWGEYFRVEGKGGSSTLMQGFGMIYLLNATGADIVSDVNLTVQCNVTATAAFTMGCTSASPRYFIIEPAGFASDYVGMGAQVT